MPKITLDTPDHELQGSPPETVAQRFTRWARNKWTPAAGDPETMAMQAGVDPANMILWKRQFAVIAKHKDKPIVRNYLWSIGTKPTAEMALEFVKDKIQQDPAFAKGSIGFRFYAVEIGRFVEVEVDFSTGVIFGVEKW